MNTLVSTPVIEAVEAFEFIHTLGEISRRLESVAAGVGDAAKGRNGFHVPVSQERYLETKKQAAILNGLPAPIALLDNDGYIISINEAWRQFSGTNVLAAQEHRIGLNYLEICNGAQVTIPPKPSMLPKAYSPFSAAKQKASPSNTPATRPRKSAGSSSW